MNSSLSMLSLLIALIREELALPLLKRSRHRQRQGRWRPRIIARQQSIAAKLHQQRRDSYIAGKFLHDRSE
ncbi:hypothetical protein M0R45_026748 [Rubus argutus]|uniref:Secreted protein n=1 Tax=Rubus argutus TaxID=59490 RepID=A0AAW1X068_RUBAR